jgi:hypothetical protein
LAEPRRVLVGRDVGDPFGQLILRGNDGKGRRTLRVIGADDHLDPKITDLGHDRVEDLRGGGNHGAITSVRDVAADLLKQRIHRAAAIAVELDPYRGRGALQLDPLCGFGEWQGAGNTRAGCLDRLPRAVDGRVAASGEEHRRLVEIGHGSSVGRDRVHWVSPWMKSGTEHGLVNAHSGQKLDEFGSTTDLSQLTINKRRT